MFSGKKDLFRELAATFYDKVGSPKAVTDKERHFAKLFMGSHQFVKNQRNIMVEKRALQGDRKITNLHSTSSL